MPPDWLPPLGQEGVALGADGHTHAGGVAGQALQAVQVHVGQAPCVQLRNCWSMPFGHRRVCAGGAGHEQAGGSGVHGLLTTLQRLPVAVQLLHTTLPVRPGQPALRASAHCHVLGLPLVPAGHACDWTAEVQRDSTAGTGSAQTGAHRFSLVVASDHV